MTEPINSHPPVNPAAEPDSQKKPTPSAWRELLSTVGILASALVVALIIITFIFRSYQVDGPSMETTLSNADKLIIWKVPRTWASITDHHYIPKRSDIIVFNQNGLSQFGQQDSKQLIKRVIALPGERVIVSDGKITVYNAQYPQGFQPDSQFDYGKTIATTSGQADYTLADDEVFVAGDNRSESLDSRSFGPIKADQIVGKLTLRLFPLSGVQKY